MLFGKRSQAGTVQEGLAQLERARSSLVHAISSVAAEIGGSGVKLPNVKMRDLIPDVKLGDLKPPEEIQLPNVTLPKLSFGDVQRQDVQLPDVTIPRFSRGDVKRNDVQLPDITLPRLSLGKATIKDVDLRPFAHGTTGGLRRVIRLAVVSLLALAVIKEMSQREDQRQWHGRVLRVPYDFRPPTPQRFRDAWWNEDAGLITATPWGLGWTINFRQLLKLAQQQTPLRAKS